MMSNIKGTKKGDNTKGKNKALAYKLQFDIESSADLQGILEQNILDAKIEFTLREILCIAREGVRVVIIDVIKKKMQITVKTVMVNALDSQMTKEKDNEIEQMFALRCDSMDTSDKIKEYEVISLEINKEKGDTNKSQTNDIAIEAQISQCEIDTNWMSDCDVWIIYTHKFSVRDTLETHVKIEGLGKPILALIDYVFKINIVSKNVYEKCQ